MKTQAFSYDPGKTNVLSEVGVSAPDYPEDWQSFRENALARDSYRCRNCGSTQDLDVHHIVPLSRGGTNHLDNLVTLCRRCHTGVHPHMEQLRTGAMRTTVDWSRLVWVVVWLLVFSLIVWFFIFRIQFG